MTTFDLIFIFAFLASVVILMATIVAAIGGRRRSALGRLLGLGVFVSVYLAVVVAASLTSPQRLLALNEPQCFDDWCLSVDHVEQAPAGGEVSYAVTLRLFSRARRRTQRESGASVYLLDDRGRRYEPLADPRALPLNARLSPGESLIATRRFTVPADTPNPGLVIAHGRLPGMFIIGDDQSLFHKPSVIRFP
jgi:hypothetical protein